MHYHRQPVANVKKKKKQLNTQINYPQQRCLYVFVFSLFAHLSLRLLAPGVIKVEIISSSRRYELSKCHLVN